MGAGQSAESRNGDAGDAAGQNGLGAQSLYEVMGLEDDADDGSIRKSYKRLALQYHPDKNPGHEEEANRRFHIIQAAYEVLSDPQERAWYDAHKDDALGEGEVAWLKF
jgi:curved DNA-binding protein CbpA